ncbi:TPA: hypothetical protein N0F65_008781 [Lagenidium giganteum]|uniref:Beta-glucan synthesis-associated protein n=1 Tax=Lagenidium giganteum TaxID=4803 RepID=A0AAV2Z5I7_9STRA|nr:TPA: hypothetical protein N0F65_008781 [Lagenidium giganteum]
MSSIECDDADPRTSQQRLCYLQIKVVDEVSTVSVYNMYTRPPGFTNATFYYRSAMLQSWNKFCFQSGMVELRVQLPGATSKSVRNPDIERGDSTARVEVKEYYPTWPGIWLMGNLGRAIFSASTNRMWPFSYNECNASVFNASNQRISACDADPGSGMHPFQGRGAPEIDILEGGGTDISSSIQIGPGMAKNFRRLPVNNTLFPSDLHTCMYSQTCQTPGANLPGVPTELYRKRHHRTWYQGLRYGANDLCKANATAKQAYRDVVAALVDGVEANTCDLGTCPASHDVSGDLAFMDGNRRRGRRWGINSRGTCFAVINAYTGSFLCDPDSTDPNCQAPRSPQAPQHNVMAPFSYQMDAISANWGVHVGVYTSFVVYQLEWVTGDEGYVRWMVEGMPVFEIPGASIRSPPQDAYKTNVVRLVPEEPMYIILNVALSGVWGTTPPNSGRPCRGDGTDALANRICSGFPMAMKIDYVRLYQDVGENSRMAIGCDPPTHPTRQWILNHRDDYEDNWNRHVDVHGGASCHHHDDCTIARTDWIRFRTGRCGDLARCVCTTKYWGGPRCTLHLPTLAGAMTRNGTVYRLSFGPPMALTIPVSVLSVLAAIILAVLLVRKDRRIRAEVALVERHRNVKKPAVKVNDENSASD